MSTGVTIIILLILIIILIFFNVWLTDVARTMVVGSDNNQLRAQNILIVTVVIGWISVAIIVIGGLILMFSSSPTSSKKESGGGSSYIISGFLILVVIIFLFEGIMATIAAVYIRNGANYSDNEMEYTRVVVVATFSLVIAFIATIAFFYNITAKYRAKSEEDELMALL